MLLSIIIISYNEEFFIERTINSVLQSKTHNNQLEYELILCDGGSSDNTVKIAEPIVDSIIHSPLARYKQMNIGAEKANGDFLLFLHGDTLLPRNFSWKLTKTLQKQNIIGGGFQKSWYWDKNTQNSKVKKPIMWLWEAFGNWTVKLLKTFPGDNAIFVKKGAFEAVQGFSSLLICEDFDFIKKLKKYCKKKKCKITCINAKVSTSARRFEDKGFLKTLLTWGYIYLLWRFRLSKEKLNLLFRDFSISK